MSFEKKVWLITWNGKQFVKTKQETQFDVQKKLLKNIIQISQKKQTVMKNCKKYNLHKLLMINLLKRRGQRLLKYYEKKSYCMLHADNSKI